MNKFLNQYGLFVGQILSYLCFFYSLTILTPLQFSTAFFIYFVIFSLGIVIGYHRLLSHKSFKTRFTKLLSIIGCLSFQGSPLAWVCLHRSHHAHTDTEKDPHSPKNGWLKSFFGSSISETNPRLIRDMLRDKFQIFLYKYYFLLMAIYIGFMSLFGIEFFMIYCALPICFSWIGVNLVNSVCHAYGYRNYKMKNQSTNNLLVALLTFGEGYHNNHHYQPANPNFAHKWYEFDISSLIIKCISTSPNR